MLSEDATILELLDLEEATPVEIAKTIVRRRQWHDLAGNMKRLCIHLRPSSSRRNEIISEAMVQVDAYVPALEDHIALLLQERVKVLLHERKIGKRTLYFYTSLGDVPTLPELFCASTRFTWFHTI